MGVARFHPCPLPSRERGVDSRFHGNDRRETGMAGEGVDSRFHGNDEREETGMDGRGDGNDGRGGGFPFPRE